jgi:hypothetical protein
VGHGAKANCRGPRKAAGIGHAREASHEARSWGFQPHGARSVVILRKKCRDSGGWLVGPPLNFFFLFISIILTQLNIFSIYFDRFNEVFRLRRPTAVAHAE